MDVALTIHELVPGAKYFGSVTANTKEAFDKINWRDSREKPTWVEMEAKWVELESTINEDKVNEALIQDKIRELAVIELKAEGKLPIDFDPFAKKSEI